MEFNEIIEIQKQTIDRLERELDKCLDTADIFKVRSDIKQSKNLDYTISNVAAAVFFPDCYLKNKEELSTKDRVWCRLPYILINRPEFDEYWTKKSFRRAFNFVNETKDSLNRSRNMENVMDIIQECINLADYWIHGVTLEEHEGTVIMRDAIEKLYNIDSKDILDLEEEDINDLFFSIQIIIQCQRMSLYSI